MAAVRTDPSGLQQSWNSRVHTTGSVVLLACLPFGICAGLAKARRRWLVLAWLLLIVAAVSLTLLLFAAAGYDSAGLGPQESWAFWQTVAILAETGDGRRLRGRGAHDPGARRGGSLRRRRPPARSPDDRSGRSQPVWSGDQVLLTTV